MDKIKNILNPGHKDDEKTMYGSEVEKDHAARQTSTIADDRQISSNAQAHQNEPMDEGNGVLRQIVNPNHDKYNEAQFGPAGSNTARTELPPTVGADQTLYTKPEAEKKEGGGILRQILNPGGSRHDDIAYGTTATTSLPKQDGSLYSSPEAQEASTQKEGVLRQILNPGGDKYDPIMHNTTASTNPAAFESELGTAPPVIKDSAIDSHHTGRDAGLATGAGALGSSTLAHREKPTSSATDGLQVVNTAAGPRIPGSSITAPGLAAAAVNDGTTDDPSVVGDAHNTIGSSGIHSGSTGHHHDTPVRTVDTALGPRVPGSSITAPGLASAATADGAEFDEGLGSTRSTAGVTDSSVQRPGDLPIIPATGGEFLGGAAPGAYSSTAGDRSFPLSGTSTATPATGHGLNDGRAGLAGAAGAATGLAAFTTHEHGGHQHNYEGPSLGSNRGTEGHAPGGPHTTMIANLLDPNIGGSSSTGTTSGFVPTTSTTAGPTSGLSSSGLGSSGSTVGDHGLSRETALSNDSAGPAKNTVGPHSADWKNVLDPRVRPDFSSQSAGTGVPATGAAYQETTGRNTSAAPVQGERGINSGTANPYSSTALDPRVDGALGAGAAGVGASGLAAGHHGAPNPSGGATIGTASGTTATTTSPHNAATTTTGQQFESGVAQEKKHAHELDEARSREAEKAHGHHEGEKKEGFLHKLLHRHKDEEHK